MVDKDDWDAEKMLDLYLHDYLVKKNMHKTAELFRQETGISHRSVEIGSPQESLQDWWSLFYDIFSTAKAEKVEDQSQNLGPMLSPQLMKNQQMARQVPIPRYSDSSSSLLQRQKHLAQHQVQKERNQGISLGNTFPINSTTSYGPQKGKLPVTLPHAAGTKLSTTISDAELSARESNKGLALIPRNLTPTFPRSSPKQKIIENYRQMAIQKALAEQYNSQYNLLQQLQAERKKKKLSNLTMADQKLDCIKAGEDKLLDDTVDSFLSHDDDNADNTSTPFKILRHRFNRPNKTEHNGFTFGEVSCLHSCKSKVLSCRFSSDGRFLASAGHEKKVLIWNIETLDIVRTSEGHSLLITDVCFRQSSTIFATSSFDKTVKIWDSAKPSKSLFKLVGHAEQVLSLDFHPRTVDLLCSCDSNNEMRLWNINKRTCIHVSKEATKQVRFQPELGKLIATASGNVINVIDVETNKPQSCLKGHGKDVLSICWDPCGKYIASISEDSARVWSVPGGECLHELRSTGNKFQSCTFHPAYSQLLVIGGYQCLELWNPIESNKTLTVEAHRGLISSLAYCLQTEMIASASHDKCVKLWK
ncbi:hypothetical protein HRI_002823900 [Hibiscus trionum]|uniref:LisH domain-containing protein n=1 Tax=Hibiscus trionum TaxID=183268 RepID=A0A9W7IA00_HIBTR|nr:hypothetical protein HRI_002823900 [Hibiscus trionum]